MRLRLRRLTSPTLTLVPTYNLFVMSKLKNLHDLLLEQLKDIYSAETQLVKALPAMAKAATDPTLQSAFSRHLEETKIHVTRLEEIFDEIGETPRGKTCKAMKGLIAEGKEMIEEPAAPAVRDAGLIAAAQRVEHYEIAAYGTTRTFAEVLGHSRMAETLQATLDEEAATDEKLTGIAGALNAEAEFAHA